MTQTGSEPLPPKGVLGPTFRPDPTKREPICFSPHLYPARNQVERFFNKIKQCRRVATRYDKLAANYLAFVQLASIRLWLRVNESALVIDDFSFVHDCARQDGSSAPSIKAIFENARNLPPLWPLNKPCHSSAEKVSHNRGCKHASCRFIHAEDGHLTFANGRRTSTAL